jgi:hypothetical protein
MNVLIRLEPDLSHCIETVARRRYEDDLRRALSVAGDDAELAGEIETLVSFLASADFRRLRCESEQHLVEGRKVSFLVSRDGGRAVWTMEVGSDEGAQPGRGD